MTILKEHTYKGHNIIYVRDIWGQEWAIIPSLRPNVGFASVSDAKREIDGKQRKWSTYVL